MLTIVSEERIQKQAIEKYFEANWRAQNQKLATLACSGGQSMQSNMLTQQGMGGKRCGARGDKMKTYNHARGSQTHATFLIRWVTGLGIAQHIKASLTVPGVGERRFVSVEVLLDSGLGVKTISEELMTRMQAEMPGIMLTHPFHGQARVVIALG